MARPKKQTVDYFPHDAHASEGDTLTVLQSRYKNDGYAFWFKLLEKLASSEGHFIDCSSPIKWQVFLAKMGVDELLGVEIMNLLVEMQAIDPELWRSKLIWCQKLVDNVADVYKNRRQELPRKPITTPDNPITTPETEFSPVEIPQTKLNKTILNKSRKEILKKFELFWKAYPKKRNRGQAEKAFEKVAPDEQLMTAIMTAIEQAKKSAQWLKDDGQYIPYPATWLNAKGWEDEYLEGRPQHEPYRGNPGQKPAGAFDDLES